MRPWKKWLLRTAAALLVTTAVYFAQGWWRQSQARGRLDEARGQLDAADPGWRLDQMQAARAKAFPPDDQNITVLAVGISKDTPKAFEEFLVRAEQPTPWLPERELNHLPAPDKLADARKTCGLCKDVIARSRKLAALTAGGVLPPPAANPLNTLLDHVQRGRTVAGLLRLNAVVLAADKDADAAIGSCRAALHLVHAIGDEPTLISMLVRIAISVVAVRGTEQVLAYGEPKAGLAEFQAELLREADEPLLEYGFRGERGFLDATFDFLRDHPDGMDNMMDGITGRLSPTTWLGLLAFRSRLMEDHVTVLGVLTRYLEIVRGPSHEWLPQVRAIDPKSFEGPFVRLLLPAAEKMVLAGLRNKAQLRTLAVGLACERFRQANKRWPTSLAELPKTILAAVPTDPYTGEALKYRALPDGIVVYTVGDDGADDNGNLTRSNPKPGEDVGVRLWSPAFRRAAPLPEGERGA